jgi:maleylacetate reductase
MITHEVQPGAWLYDALESRVVFGVGRAADAREEIERLGGRRTLLVASAGTVHRNSALVPSLGDQVVGHYSGVLPHCPIETVEAALAMYRELDADSVLTVGGGSAIGIAKNLRMQTAAKSVVIATTYSGAEMTPIYGAKSSGEKRTGRDPKAKPQVVIYDPLYTLDLPVSETIATGMNGLAHCVEALYPKTSNPVASALAAEGIAAFFRGLPGSVATPRDVGCRSEALRGGFVGGLLVQLVGIGLHHRICHVLGGRFGIAHGVSNSVVLPYVAEFNREAISNAASGFADFGGQPGQAIRSLSQRIGAAPSLRSVGLPREALRAVAEETLAHDVANPRPVTVADVETILGQAWDGVEL